MCLRLVLLLLLLVLLLLSLWRRSSLLLLCDRVLCHGLAPFDEPVVLLLDHKSEVVSLAAVTFLLANSIILSTFPRFLVAPVLNFCSGINVVLVGGIGIVIVIGLGQLKSGDVTKLEFAVGDLLRDLVLGSEQRVEEEDDAKVGAASVGCDGARGGVTRKKKRREKKRKEEKEKNKCGRVECRRRLLP